MLRINFTPILHNLPTGAKVASVSKLDTDRLFYGKVGLVTFYSIHKDVIEKLDPNLYVLHSFTQDWQFSKIKDVQNRDVYILYGLLENETT